MSIYTESIYTESVYTQLIYTNIDSIHMDGPTVLTIGNFDGLHRGHQALLNYQLQLAKIIAQPGRPQPRTGLVTFDPHPLAVLRPDQPLQLLTTPQERLTLALDLGIDFGVLQTFTPEIAKLEAREFMRLLQQHLRMTALVVGPDFALGRNRSGDRNTLQALGEELGYSLHIVEPVDWQGSPVRSSIVRQILQQGDVTEAAELLGRYYHLEGNVELGDQRGRQIGIPTANLGVLPNKLLPANGVYATYVRPVDAAGSPIGAHIYMSVTNLGVRPTVDGIHHRIETHLLDFPPAGETGDLYGQRLRVEFVARLRDEQRFANLTALVAQIQTDIEQARQIFANPPGFRTTEFM